MFWTLRALGYLWAAPLSLLGLLCALPWIGGAPAAPIGGWPAAHSLGRQCPFVFFPLRGVPG